MADKWLVEIRLKDWIPTPSDGNRTIGYEEVTAENNYFARLSGFDQFVNKIKYCPTVRKAMETLNLSREDICAPDAVIIDY